MKYQQPTFTLPAGSNKVTQEEWDRIFNPPKKKRECTMCHGKSFACEMCELIKEGKL